MANPGGNYPGRQIFVGGLKCGHPAFAYFGSGRSSRSQQRYAAPFDERESAVRIKHVDPDEKFDSFRHYQAVKINPETGLAVISNSQAPVDMLAEGYSSKSGDERRHFLYRCLKLIGPENDSRENPTPRIAAALFPTTDRKQFPFMYVIGIVKSNRCIQDDRITGGEGRLQYVQTYNGHVDYGPFNAPLLFSSEMHVGATTARQLADEIYDMSDYVDPKYGELRVWCVAGVRNGNGPGGWEIAGRNRHQVE